MSTDQGAPSVDDLELTQEEEEDLLDSPREPRVPIRFRNQDIDIAGLVRRLNDKSILIPRIGYSGPELELTPFQRGFVWNNKQMDSFIESLLLDYPTPSIFLVKQNDHRLVVLDGQQRLETIRMFYSGIRGDRAYKLHLDPTSRFNGYSYQSLADSNRRNLDDTYISCTIISASTDDETAAYDAIYDVFARLNSGGTRLTPHEIRMALYNGPLMDQIDKLNRLPSWRSLYGASEQNKRFRDHELVLRVLALYLEGEKYIKPLARFLNRFADTYRSAADPSLKEAMRLFSQAANLLYDDSGVEVFSLPQRRQLNMAIADSAMAGLMRVLARRAVTRDEASQALYVLKEDDEYIASVTRSTSDEAQVEKRLSLAIKAFGDERD